MKKSIRIKIMAVFFILILIPLLIISYVFYNTENSVLIKQIKQTNSKSIENARDFYIDNMIVEINNSVNIWSDSKEIKDMIKTPENFSNISIEWQGYLKSYPQIASIYLGDKNKQFYLYPSEKLPDGYDCTQRSWYKEAIAANNREVVWTAPYADATTNEMTITVAKAVTDDNGNIAGVFAIDMRLSSLSDIALKIKLGDEGYAMIVDNAGTIIGHKDKKQLNTIASDKDWFKKLMNDPGQSIEYNVDGKQYVLGYVTEAKTGWKIIGFTPKADILSITKPVTNSIQIMIFVMIIVYIIVAALLGFFIDRKLLKPIKSIGALMSKVEKGDFNVAFNVKGEDEIGELSKSFNNMINGQKSMIKQVVSSANEIKILCEESKKSSEEMYKTSDEQSYAMGELSKTIDDSSQSIMEVSNNILEIASNSEHITTSITQMGIAADDIASNMVNTSEAMGKITDSMIEMDKSSNKINSNSEMAQKQGESTLNIVNNGKYIVNNTVNNMNNINISMLDLTKVIKELGKSATQIGEIIEIIDDIAEQTNLLSLNASIEAARAGEHGKGFAVVASAIGRLSEKSSESTKDIVKLIEQIREVTDSAIINTKNSAEQIEKGVVMVQETGNSFENIYDAVKKTTNLINEIAESTSEQIRESKSIMEELSKVNEMSMNVSASSEEEAAEISEMIKKVEDSNALTKSVASASEYQAAHSEEIAATTVTVDEMASKVAVGSEKVTKLSQSILELSNGLMELVSKFNVE